MPITRYGFESGANGDAPTTGNTGSTFAITTGGTLAISTFWAKSGSRSIKSQATAVSGASYLSYTLTSTTSIYVEIYMYVTGNPTAEIGFFMLESSGTRSLSLNLSTSRTIVLRDAGGAGGASQFTTSAIPLNTAIKVGLFVTQNASTGTFRLAWADSPYTTWDSDSGVVTGKNTGANPYTTCRIGAKVGTGTQALDAVYFDDWGWQAGVSNFPANPPVLVGPSSQSPFVFFDLNQTTADVGPVTYSATPSTGVVPTSTGLFLPAPTDGSTTTYTVTATDTGNGATTNTSVDVATPAGGGVETVVWNGFGWE